MGSGDQGFKGIQHGKFASGMAVNGILAMAE